MYHVLNLWHIRLRFSISLDYLHRYAISIDLVQYSLVLSYSERAQISKHNKLKFLIFHSLIRLPVCWMQICTIEFSKCFFFCFVPWNMRLCSALCSVLFVMCRWQWQSINSGHCQNPLGTVKQIISSFVPGTFHTFMLDT